MRREARALVLLLALAGCSHKAEPPRVLGRIAFRVLSEKQNASYCVDAPDFQLATSEAQWIDVFDQETQCQPERDIPLPDVDFAKEAGLAAWWRIDGCLGSKVHTDSIERVGKKVVVSATATSATPGTCAQARGELESFLVLEKSDLFNGSQPLTFVLNGVTVGTENPTQQRG